MKYIVSIDVLYREDIWVEAKTEEEALQKAFDDKGVRIGRPQRDNATKEIRQVRETDLEID